MSHDSDAGGTARRGGLIVPALIILMAHAGAAQAAPFISGTPPASVVAAHDYSFQPQSGAASHARLSFSVRNLPGWAHFDASTGRIHGTPLPPGNVGTFPNIVITVSDGSGQASLAAFSITVKPLLQEPPVISGMPASRVRAGAPYSFQPHGSDPNGLRIAWSIWNRPAWASFDAATGRLYGTPRAGAAGTTSNIVITAYDGYFRATLPAFSITVGSGVNAPPSIAGRPPLTVAAGSLYSFRPAASDADGDPLTFSVQNKPAWASFDARTGLLSGMPGANAVGSHANIVISVSDGHATATLPPFSIAVTQSAGSSATLSWVAPTLNTDGSPLADLAGFRLYYGSHAAQLDRQLTLPNPGLSTWVVSSLTPGTWYFAVAAYNALGTESVRSEVVSFAAP